MNTINSEIFKKKSLKIATHTDMDGVCVAALFLRKFPDKQIEFHFISVDEAKSFSYEENQFDFTCDLPKIGISLNIDHHRSNYEQLLAEGRLESNDIIDPEAPSATTLVYKNIGLTEDEIATEINNFANLADTGKTPPEFRKLDLSVVVNGDKPSMLLEISKKIAEFGPKITHSAWIDEIFSKIKAELDATHQTINNFVKLNSPLPKIVLLDSRGKISSRFVKEVFKPIFNTGTEVMGVIYTPNNKKLIKISFRVSHSAQNRDKYKVNSLAENFGGGGHPAAAAFATYDEDDINELVILFQNFAMTEKDFVFLHL